MPPKLPPRPEADQAGQLRCGPADPPLPSDPCHLLRLACQIADYEGLDRSEARVLATLLAQGGEAPPNGSA